MNTYELTYRSLLQKILIDGQLRENRTGVTCKHIPFAHLHVDLREGFPLLTGRKLPVKSIMAELCAFLRGATSAQTFRELGTKIWDKDANENGDWLRNPNRKGDDDLGLIYGAQWRRWRSERAADGVDQLTRIYEELIMNPDSRRLFVSAWNVDALQDMALPPCHTGFQLVTSPDNTLSMTVNLRASDAYLGLPFNVASYAALLHLFAWLSDREPASLNCAISNVEVYMTHEAALDEYLQSAFTDLPKMEFKPSVTWLESDDGCDFSQIQPDWFHVTGYTAEKVISAPMATTPKGAL